MFGIVLEGRGAGVRMAAILSLIDLACICRGGHHSIRRSNSRRFYPHGFFRNDHCKMMPKIIFF